MKVLGVLLIVLGIALGLYVGVWVMFIGGIFEIVDFIKLGLEDYSMLAWGIIKIILSSLVGWLCAFILIVPGGSLIGES